MPGPDWCAFCQLPLSQCPHAVNATALADGNPMAVLYEAGTADLGHRIGPLIEAKYHGRCRGCPGEWEPGDDIAYDEEQDGWICASCADL